MQKVLDQLNTGEALYKEEPPALADLKREFPPLGAGSLAAFAGKVGYEYLWHKVSPLCPFLLRYILIVVVFRPKIVGFSSESKDCPCAAGAHMLTTVQERRREDRRAGQEGRQGVG